MISPQLSARVIRAGRACRDLGITQEQIAHALGASQSQVSRVLSGRGRRFSRLTEEVCAYVERVTRKTTLQSVRDNDELINAIREAWDGSAQHARALATVIKSLTALSPRSRSHGVDN